MIGSLDVENLFTNVWANKTLDIILDYSYNNENLAPFKIPEDSMKTLLAHCTTETAFRHPNGDLYRQVGGVAKGFP